MESKESIKQFRHAEPQFKLWILNSEGKRLLNATRGWVAVAKAEMSSLGSSEATAHILAELVRAEETLDEFMFALWELTEGQLGQDVLPDQQSDSHQTTTN